jgi:hypothetical protein
MRHTFCDNTTLLLHNGEMIPRFHVEDNRNTRPFVSGCPMLPAPSTCESVAAMRPSRDTLDFGTRSQPCLCHTHACHRIASPVNHLCGASLAARVVSVSFLFPVLLPLVACAPRRVSENLGTALEHLQHFAGSEIAGGLDPEHEPLGTSCRCCESCCCRGPLLSLAVSEVLSSCQSCQEKSVLVARVSLGMSSGCWWVGVGALVRHLAASRPL